MTTETMKSDLLWGVAQIAAEIGQTPRQVFYALENRRLPGGRVGERWVASRKALREHFERVTQVGKFDLVETITQQQKR